jgi:hypothetical protein
VQIWNVSTGGDCTYAWLVAVVGKVGSSPVGNVFYCGDDLNAKYYGDPVYLVEFGGQEATGEGNNFEVWLADEVHPYQGYWVGVGSNQGDTELVDAYTSCGWAGGKPAYVYAQGKASGDVVAESTSPPSLLFWTYNEEIGLYS